MLALLRRNRMLWTISGTALLALVAGLVSGRALAPLTSTTAPEAGYITAPVAHRELHNVVTTRADVVYADAVDVTVDTSSLSGPAVVTGSVPAVGTRLKALSIALEVAGRPVIVLPGDLPAYRTLRFGVSGPDVSQFKKALRSVGIDGGDPADSAFTAQTAAAITRLYATIGYPAPTADAGADDALHAAQDGLAAAQQALAAAQNARAEAAKGPSDSEKTAADNAVADAQRQFTAAQRATPRNSDQVAQLQGALRVAQQQRAELLAPPDVSAETLAVTSAQTAVTQARDTLTKAQQADYPVLPAGEVLFLSSLPRQVDSVAAHRGAVLTGAAMKVSGATLSLQSTLSAPDAKLLKVGMGVDFQLPDGSAAKASVAHLAVSASDSTQWTMSATPGSLTPAEVQQLQGQNVLAQIPVASTKGKVLAVPAAALSSGPGGETRVEVVTGDPKHRSTATTRLVVVTTGLATADGVEVTPVDGGALHENDRVVIGK